MRNCLKNTQQCQNDIFEKCVGQQQYVISYMDLPLTGCTYRRMGNTLITDAKKTCLTAVLLTGFKNRYVNANINLQ